MIKKREIKPRKCEHCEEIFTPKYYNIHWCEKDICQEAYIEWKRVRNLERGREYEKRQKKDRDRKKEEEKKIPRERTNWTQYKTGICWSCPSEGVKKLNRFGLCKTCYIWRNKANERAQSYGSMTLF